MNKKLDLRKVLFIGPYHKNLKGGISEVIKSYKNYFGEQLTVFNTLSDKGIVLNTFFFLIRIPKFILMIYKFDIFHIHTSINGSFYRNSILFAIIKILKKNSKIVLQIHSGNFIEFYKKNKIRRFFIDIIFKNSNQILFLTQNQKKFFESQNNYDTEVINNPIKSQNQKIHFKKDGKITLLFLGKISKSKGIFDLIEVIIKNKQYLIDKVELKVAGNGEIKKLINIVNDNEIENLVSIVGWIKGKDKDRLLEASDIIILPSYHEAMPMSILEGLSYSMPIISTKVGSIPELVNETNGFLIEPGNKKMMEESIKKFIQNKSLIKEQGLKSYNKSKLYFIENTIEHLKEIYRNL